MLVRLPAERDRGGGHLGASATTIDTSARARPRWLASERDLGEVAAQATTHHEQHLGASATVADHACPGGCYCELRLADHSDRLAIVRDNP